MLKYVKLNPMYGLRISHSLSEALSRTRIAIWKQLWFRSLCECTTSSVYLSCSFPLPPSCQPVLHSCCSNPLRLLPALWSRSEHPSPFSPLSFFFFHLSLHITANTFALHISFTSAVPPLPVSPFPRHQGCSPLQPQSPRADEALRSSANGGVCACSVLGWEAACVKGYWLVREWARCFKPVVVTKQHGASLVSCVRRRSGWTNVGSSRSELYRRKDEQMQHEEEWGWRSREGHEGSATDKIRVVLIGWGGWL